MIDNRDIKYYKMKKAILLIGIIFFSLASAGERKSGETKYKAIFQAKLQDCEDFTNEAVDTEALELDDEEYYLEGDLGINNELADGIQMNLEISKYNGDDLEIVATMKMGLCEAIKEKDAPWASVFEMMGITECPIPAKTFGIDKLTIDISFADEFMSHEYVGEYVATLVLSKVDKDDAQSGEQVVSCHNFILSVIEYKDE